MTEQYEISRVSEKQDTQVAVGADLARAAWAPRSDDSAKDKPAEKKATNEKAETASYNDFTVVNAASYAVGNISGREIVAAFGSGIAPNGLKLAATRPLPEELNGVEVRVKTLNADGRLVMKNAELLAVGSNQINFVVPNDVAIDAAKKTTEIEIINNGAHKYAEVPVGKIAPGIFTVNQAGTDTPAAQVYNAKTGDYVRVPSDTITQGIVPGEDQYLVLYGTGFRGNAGHVKVEIGTPELGFIEIPATYAGRQGNDDDLSSSAFVGQDQMNISLAKVPKGFNGGKPVDLKVTVDGEEANTTKIRFAKN